MTDSAEGASHPSGAEPAFPEPPPRPPLVTAALSILAVLGSFLALLQIDIPIMRFLRSLDLSAVQRFGDFGEKLGNGGTLVTVSVVVLGLGFALKRDPLKRAAVDSLLAHGVVGLLVNGLKHLIGRPRPRLTHGSDWQWWPSWETGLDSFPSGHTSSTVAVVTVLMRVLPSGRWAPFLLVAWVAASRIWRGSHFPSDVLAGLVAGFVVGSVFNAPLRWWARSSVLAMVRIAPVAACIAGTVWVVCHRIVDPATDIILLVSGTLLIAGGMALRLWPQPAANGRRNITSVQLSPALTGLGFGVATGAPVIMVLAGLVCLAWLGASQHGEHVSANLSHSRTHAVLRVAGSAIALILIQGLKGLIPLR